MTPASFSRRASRRTTPLIPVVLGTIASATAAQVPPVFLCGQATQAGTVVNVALNPCTSPVTMCASHVATPVGFEGGSAFDPVHQVVWNSNGSRLQGSLSTMGFECDMQCDAPSPVPQVTGLAFDARTARLWILSAAPEIVRATVAGFDCPVVESRCSLEGVIPAGTIAAGLALSEKRGLLFYSASALGTAPSNVVIVASTAEPCRALCSIDLGRPFGETQTEPITGLGYDDCDDELFAVAGSTGILRARLSFPGCTVVSSSFCIPSREHRFHGLCLQAPPATVVGRDCLAAPCPRCTTRLRGNEATLGNRSFAVSVFYAPSGGVAIPVLGIGTCTAGVPALCGRFHPSLAQPVVLPALVLNGPSTCTGAATLRIPIAAEGALCGLQLCLQAVIACPAGGFGLTEALGIRVYGA